jgi:hypothetical protein
LDVNFFCQNLTRAIFYSSRIEGSPAGLMLFLNINQLFRIVASDEI